MTGQLPMSNASHLRELIVVEPLDGVLDLLFQLLLVRWVQLGCHLLTIRSMHSQGQVKARPCHQPAAARVHQSQRLNRQPGQCRRYVHALCRLAEHTQSDVCMLPGISSGSSRFGGIRVEQVSIAAQSCQGSQQPQRSRLPRHQPVELCHVRQTAEHWCLPCAHVDIAPAG